MVPPLHNESHGREAPEDCYIDLSRTVGWFTTICPLVIPAHADDNAYLARRAAITKDMRRRIPGNGRPYFAHKYLSDGGTARDEPSASSPMEILFNYLGGGGAVKPGFEADEPLVRRIELNDDDGSAGDSSRFLLYGHRRCWTPDQEAGSL